MIASKVWKDVCHPGFDMHVPNSPMTYHRFALLAAGK